MRPKYVVLVLALFTIAIGSTALAQTRVSKGIRMGKNSVSIVAPELEDLDVRIDNLTTLQTEISRCGQENRFYDPDFGGCHTAEPVNVDFRKITGRNAVVIENPDGTESTYYLDGADGQVVDVSTDPDPSDPTPDPDPDPTPDPTPIDGQCKVYNQSYDTQPASNTSNGCDAGDYQEFADTSSHFRWKCLGRDNGQEAVCNAQIRVGCEPQISNSCVGGSILTGAADGSHGGWIYAGDRDDIDSYSKCVDIGGNCYEEGRRGHDGEQGADDEGHYYACFENSTGVSSSDRGAGCPEQSCQSTYAEYRCE